MAIGTIKTQIIVEQCSDCPFFERHPVNVVADLLTKRGAKSGACRFHAGRQPFPIGRMAISDEGTLPAQCPLKAGDCTITLKGAS